MRSQAQHIPDTQQRDGGAQVAAAPPAERRDNYNTTKIEKRERSEASELTRHADDEPRNDNNRRLATTGATLTRNNRVHLDGEVAREHARLDLRVRLDVLVVDGERLQREGEEDEQPVEQQHGQQAREQLVLDRARREVLDRVPAQSFERRERRQREAQLDVRRRRKGDGRRRRRCSGIVRRWR